MMERPVLEGQLVTPPRDRRRGLLWGRLFGRSFLSNLWNIGLIEPDEGMLGESPPGDVVRRFHHELRGTVCECELLCTHWPQLVEVARFGEVKILEIFLPEEFNFILP